MPSLSSLNWSSAYLFLPKLILDAKHVWSQLIRFVYPFFPKLIFYAKPVCTRLIQYAYLFFPKLIVDAKPVRSLLILYAYLFLPKLILYAKLVWYQLILFAYVFLLLKADLTFQACLVSTDPLRRAIFSSWVFAVDWRQFLSRTGGQIA